MIMQWIQWLYACCTDFVINLANLTGLSYYEINFGLFIILYPLLLLVSSVAFAVNLFRYKRAAARQY